jgi:hypothetical protein
VKLICTDVGKIERVMKEQLLAIIVYSVYSSIVFTYAENISTTYKSS